MEKDSLDKFRKGLDASLCCSYPGCAVTSSGVMILVQMNQSLFWSISWEDYFGRKTKSPKHVRSA